MRDKLWEEVMKNNMTYDEVLANVGFYFTRPEWDGFHFIDGIGNHVIITKDRETLIVTEEEVFNKDSDDWMFVSITNEAVQLVTSHQYEVLKEEKI